MSNFIELNDVDGTKRFVNIKQIAFVEEHGQNCRVVLAMPGRGEYLNFAFLTDQSYDVVQRLISYE